MRIMSNPSVIVSKAIRKEIIIGGNGRDNKGFDEEVEVEAGDRDDGGIMAIGKS